MADRDSITRVTVNLGLFSNILLSIIKTCVGIFGHSAALLADGINSTSDVVYYIAVKIFMKQAQKPADVEHPYGHRQLESISAIVVGAFILTTGIAIFWESINKVYDILSKIETGHSASSWALVIAIFTFCLKIFLYTYTRKNMLKTNNPTLKALANDHLNDIMASIAVIVGVLLGRLGYYWMDPAAGAIVAIYIIKTGIEIIMESSRELMDYLPDEDFSREIRTEALAVEGVRSIEELGIHRFGPYYTVNMTITVDGAISVDDGNNISDKVEKRLLDKFSSGLRQVHIHYHPYTEKISLSNNHPENKESQGVNI
ncbi:MAG TPA: cation diffusion facilitator family transporter [Candidatus Cloacimonas sp.]|jgi:cation diffusion facilitator family transporter|nr:cation transporter [Candidatus Cloacimonas sp.]MDD2249968.1 cation diffusion facilitator family transporter [Candidatus Cloacimonadota bacterium]MCK9158687.1 cation diffusion facilitator family transporter [Candidatus Cloacimonas sp.]MCK9165644.1 cation diffusion facilitator family transporter [Candidatus Cloacimonas sp.]MDD3733444.1 cation diffusion facilitator family transporter [Candidatus Cloacimonadota bacterium]